MQGTFRPRCVGEFLQSDLESPPQKSVRLLPSRQAAGRSDWQILTRELNSLCTQYGYPARTVSGQGVPHGVTVTFHNFPASLGVNGHFFDLHGHHCIAAVGYTFSNKFQYLFQAFWQPLPLCPAPKCLWGEGQSCREDILKYTVMYPLTNISCFPGAYWINLNSSVCVKNFLFGPHHLI